MKNHNHFETFEEMVEFELQKQKQKTESLNMRDYYKKLLPEEAKKTAFRQARRLLRAYKR